MGREEEYTVSFDVSDDGSVHLAVVLSKTRKNFSSGGGTYEELKCVNRIVGPQADELYKKLINKRTDSPNYFENREHSGLLDT